ncbi:MAG: DUF4058 family protein, partial [Chloroflexota bacterium]
MSSPFPGMDPYLEGDLWSSFHTHMSIEIIRQLTPKIQPRYAAVAMKHFIMEQMEDIVISYKKIAPDVGVTERPTMSLQKDSGVEIEPQVSLAAPLRFATVMNVPTPKITLEIRDTNERQLVTVIEILSPINKTGKFYEEYIEKRTNILNSSAHLLEIDLLRKGHRVPMWESLPDASYFIFLSRAKQRPFTDIWPIKLKEQLPQIPVPLLDNDDDAILDLQAVFESVYKDGGYAGLVDYTQSS